MAYEILPAIFEKDSAAIEEKLRIVKPFAKTIHLDLLDGVFAPNTSFTEASFFTQYKDDFLFELHMMVDDPIKHIHPWAEAGITRFIGHIERMPDQEAFLEEASEYGEAALALDLKTPVEKLAVSVDDVDALLVMTVNAGFSGQPFIEKALEKVRVLRSQSATVPIEVDGGINHRSIDKAIEAGANRFAVTSYLFSSDSPQTSYNILKAFCQSRTS